MTILFQIKVDRAHLCALTDVCLGDLKDALNDMTTFIRANGISLESILSGLESSSCRTDNEIPTASIKLSNSASPIAVPATEDRDTYTCSIIGRENIYPSNKLQRCGDFRASFMQSFKNPTVATEKMVTRRTENTLSSDFSPNAVAASISSTASTTVLKVGTIRCRKDYENLRDAMLADKRMKSLHSM